MVTLSCGCWYLTPEEVTLQAGYSDGPITTSATCPRCMRLRLKNIELRSNFGNGGQLDFFEELPRPPMEGAAGASPISVDCR